MACTVMQTAARTGRHDGTGSTGGAVFISQKIAFCEIKSLRRDAQLEEKKLARARNKSCAAKAVVRGVCKAHFCYFTENCVL